MPVELVTVRSMGPDGNVLGEEQRELMVRRPHDLPAYALLPGSVRRPLVSDDPPTIKARLGKTGHATEPAPARSCPA